MIKIFASQHELSEALAREIINLIGIASGEKSAFSIAVSGGNTPKQLFTMLGDRFGELADWKLVHFFWVDERCVPPDHIDSNFRMTQDSLFSRINIPADNIHRIRGEDDPEAESLRYENDLRKSVAAINGLPSFNLMLLGLGVDGHTASIFPGNEALFHSERLCVSTVNPSTGQRRITLTGKVINNSASVVFHVTGSNKAEIVSKIIDPNRADKLFPASLVVTANNNLAWFLDKEAGALLDKET